MAYWLLRSGLGLVFAAAVAAGGCYTGPINMRPTVEINPPDSRIFRGQPSPPYTAQTPDPDNDEVTLQWTTIPGACPSDFRSPDAWPKTPDWVTGRVFMVGPSDTRSMYCVWAKATDSHGAQAVDVYTEKPLNHLPEPRIDVERPAAPELTDRPDTFPLHTLFKLTAAASTDADLGDREKLTFEWRLREGPPSSMVALHDCAHEESPETTCLDADVPGDYVVELSVGDMIDTTVTRRTLHVEPGHAPIARLKVVLPLGDGPFPLGTRFRVSAAESYDADARDKDKLRFAWTVDYSRAPSSSEDFGQCPDVSDQAVRCFIADGPGEYSVTVRAIDPANNQSDPVTLTVRVLTDQMPCLGPMDPDFEPTLLSARAQERKEFQVINVLDDLDPFPNPMALNDAAKFDWFVSTNGVDFELRNSNSDFPSFTLSSSDTKLGSDVWVRVQIRDRNTERSRAAFVRCGNEPSCFSGAESDGCFQRWTWKVRVNQ